MQPDEAQAKDLVWTHDWLSSAGEKLVSYARDGSGHCLRFPSLADFRISADAKEVTCLPEPGIPEETLRHLLIDQVLPRCLAHGGELVLHASAVVLRRKALLFIGETHSGKSTLAGSFHQAGYPAVSDDVLLLKDRPGDIRAIPSYGGLRLWQDSLLFLFAGSREERPMAHYSAKRRVKIEDPEAREYKTGIPVLAVIVLSAPHEGTPTKMDLSQLPPREAFMQLQRQSFALTAGSSKIIGRHMQTMARIVHRLPVLQLRMPRDYKMLSTVRSKILDYVK
jgi:hypothetical protein